MMNYLTAHNANLPLTWKFSLYFILITFIDSSSSKGLTIKRSHATSQEGQRNDMEVSSFVKGTDWSDFMVKPAILTRSSENKMPYFDKSTDQQVVTSPGVTAYLHCRVRNLGSKMVSWIRHRDFHILTAGVFKYTNYEHFTALHKDGTDDWTLQISQPTIEDQGLYECQVSTSPKISRFVKLIVRDELNDRERTTKLPESKAIKSIGRRWKNDAEHRHYIESEEKTIIPLAPDHYVRPGETVSVSCYVVNDKSKSKYIKWYHKFEEIKYGPRSPKVSITFKPGVNSSSTLTIEKFAKADTGRYICDPENSYEAYLSIHVVDDKNHAAVFKKKKKSSSVTVHAPGNMCATLVTLTIMTSWNLMAWSIFPYT